MRPRLSFCSTRPLPGGRRDGTPARLDFDLFAAATYGRVRAQLEAVGTPIGPNDMLIAAHALSRALRVVTDNVAEFGRVKGLKVENWR